jgi:hypothetical protein
LTEDTRVLFLRALLCAANVNFHGPYETIGVMCALMGSSSPPTVRKMVVEELGTMNGSAFADPVILSIVAMLGSTSRTHIAEDLLAKDIAEDFFEQDIDEDILEEAPSAAGDVRLSSSALRVVSRLIQCPATRSAFHEQATNLTVSGKCEQLALIRLHSLSSDWHTDFEKYVQGHAGLFIHKFYMQSDFFRRCQERAWRPGAGDDVGGPAFHDLMLQHQAELSPPLGPALYYSTEATEVPGCTS